jgi:regulator of sigma E protease
VGGSRLGRGAGGLQPGDIIRALTVDNPDWDQVDQRAYEKPGPDGAHDRGPRGQTLSLAAPSRAEIEAKTSTSAMLAFSRVRARPHRRAEVQPAPAAQAGCATATQSSVDGHAFHTVTQSLLAYMQSGAGQAGLAGRGAQRRRFCRRIVAHPAKLDPMAGSWALNAAPEVPVWPLPLPTAAASQPSSASRELDLIVEVLGRSSPARSRFRSLSGPVGIARMAGHAAEMKGWLPKFGLASAISLNLGISTCCRFPSSMAADSAAAD